MKYMVALLLLAGCGSSRPKETPIEIERRSETTSKIIEAKREPGSLWSEGSHWNEIYRATPSRMIGDIVLIKPTESLRRKLFAMAKRPDNRLADKGKENKGMLNAKENRESGEPKAVNEGPESLEISSIAASIRDSSLRGIYGVYSNQLLKIGPMEHQIVLVGNIRERDISPEDTIASDAVFNLRVDLIQSNAENNKKKVVVKEEKVMEEKNSKASQNFPPEDVK